MNKCRMVAAKSPQVYLTSIRIPNLKMVHNEYAPQLSYRTMVSSRSQDYCAVFLAADVSPLDPLAFAAMIATLVLTAGLTVYFPARRATKVDPRIALRHE
jgi:ABC-type lipoprotein release transport system permease subunit